MKTLSYAVNMAALREAERRGADDVIFVSADGVVLEAPTASVVWATERTLHTTPTGPTGILPGTTQQLLFDRAAAAGWTTETVAARVDDLHAADTVWLDQQRPRPGRRDRTRRQGAQPESPGARGDRSIGRFPACREVTSSLPSDSALPGMAAPVP